MFGSKLKILVLVTSLLVCGCVSVCREHMRKIQFPELCHDPANARGLVLLINGLNNRAEVLNEIGNQLCQLGLRVRSVELSENSAPSVTSWGVSRDLWLKQLDETIKIVRAEFPGEPLSLLGYSLGAMLALDYTLNNCADIENLFLIAPPLELGWFKGWLLGLTRFSPFDLHIPSAAEPAYRARSFTPLSHYRALKDCIEAVKQHGTDCPGAPARLTVVASRSDEFVAPEAIQAWIALNAPASQLIILEKDASSKRGMAHLIIDSHSLAQEQWLKVLQALREHFHEIGKPQQ